MSSESVPVSWGDIVRIHGVNMIKKHSTKGLIICKGFTDPNVYYQKYGEDFAEVNFYRQSLFQILPKSNFEMHDLLLDENSNQQQKQIARTRINGEMQELLKKLQAKAGQKVTNGDEFVLKHVESRAFLVGLFRAAEVGEGAFRLQITNHICQSAIFRFRSHRSYELEGHQIYFNDQLQIYHPKSDCYVNFATNETPIYLDQGREENSPIPEDHPSYKYYQARPCNKKPNQERIYVINESKSKCLWKLIQHCTYTQNKEKKNIISHDIVYFQHTKNKGLISTTLANPQYYLKEFNKETQGEDPETQSYECFWELIPKEVNEFGPQTCKIFYTRNVVTGRLLTFNGTIVEIEPQQKVEEGGFKNEGLINLICGELKQKQDEPPIKLKLQRGEIIENGSDVAPIVKIFQNKIFRYQLKSVQQLKEDSFCIYLVNEQTTLNIQFALSSHQPIVKFIEIISTKLLGSNQPPFYYPDFFMSLNQTSLSNLICIIKDLTGRIYNCSYDQIETSGNPPNPQMQKILVETGIASLLIEVIYLLEQPFIFIEENNEPCADKNIRNKISTIFELTYKLVTKIAADNKNNRIYVSRWVDQLLNQSNHINKSYIQECILGILQNNPDSIETTITEDKINDLINCFLDESRKSKGQLSTKYLRLFSTFIKCEDKIIKKNQDIILKKFFKNPENQFIFSFKIEQKEGIDNEEIPNDSEALVRGKEVHVTLKKKTQSMSIKDFYQHHRNKMNYLLGYIDLLADVCMNRNNAAIKKVDEILNLKTVVTVLFDQNTSMLNQTILEKLKKQKESVKVEQGQKQAPQILITPISNVHQPFIRIAHHAYLNNQNYNPIKIIGKICNWYGEEGQAGTQQINKTTRAFQGEQLERERILLRNMLSYITRFLEKCNQDYHNLSILKTVLDLTQISIELGFWDSIKDLKKLVPYLIMNITKIENETLFHVQLKEGKTVNVKEVVNQNKNSLKMIRPEITKLIQCKNKATIIFRQINQLETDIRLRYIMKFFKGIYKSTCDFEKYNRQLLEKESYEQQAFKQRNQIAKTYYMRGSQVLILGGDTKKSEEDEVTLKPNIWYHKLEEMTPFEPPQQNSDSPSRYIFDAAYQKNINLQNVAVALFELPAYQDIKLLNNTIKMLRAMFEQRRSLISNFRAVLICCKGNLSHVYMTLKFMRNKFDMLSNSQILKFMGNHDKDFPYDLWKNYDHLVKDQAHRSGIIQDLFYLSRTLKKNISLKNIESLMHVEQSVFDPNKIYNFLNEKQYNNSLFQSLNIAEGIYIPLIAYIKNVGHNINDPNIFTPIHHKLLFSIYQYLTMLCFNNIQAKQLMIQHIESALPHVGKRVNASDFIYEVCINNKLLVNNVNLVTKIIDRALEACNELGGGVETNNMVISNVSETNDYQKSRILFSLRGILLFSSGNPAGIKRNQEILMNRFQDSKYRSLMQFAYNKYFQSIENFNLSPQQTYIYTFYELFSIMVESQSIFNIGKLQNLHKYQDLLEKIKNTNRWQIRRALRGYLNRLFYVNKDKDIFVFEQFINSQFTNLNVELDNIFELYKTSNKKLITDDSKITNGIRFIFCQSEIIQYILQILITLHEMFLKPQFVAMVIKEMAKEDKQGEASRTIQNHLIGLLKGIGRLNKLYLNYKLIISFVAEIKRIMNPILLNLQVRFLEYKSQPLEGGPKKEEKTEQQGMNEQNPYKYDSTKTFFKNLGDMIRQLKNKELLQKLKEDFHTAKNKIVMDDKIQKNRYIDSIFDAGEANLKPIHIKPKEKEELHYKPHLQGTVPLVFKILAKPQYEQNQQNIKMNEKINEVKKLIDEHPIFNKLIDDEFNKLVKLFSKIDETSHQYYLKCWQQLKQLNPPKVFSIDDIIKNTFELIMKNPKSLDDSEKIFTIKLIRCYITQSLEGDQEYKYPIDKWDADYFDKPGKKYNPDAFVSAQQRIMACGGSKFIIQVIKEFKDSLSGRTQLLNEVLLLGIAYLFNGNSKCQNSILSELKKDQKNEMLMSVSNLVTEIGEFLIQIRKKRQNEKKRNYNLNIVDTYDYYSTQSNTLNKQFSGSLPTTYQNRVQMSYQNAFCRIFRFLQLFCESNNKDMKKFLRMQINQNGNKKDNSLNFIEIACLYLRKFFKIMNLKVVNIPTSMLDFVNQITQIPCFECQQSLMKSTFFEDISFMATSLSSPASLSSRDFNPFSIDQNNAINTLNQHYKKSIDLALSNFEGNDDNKILWEFITKCKPQFLWLVIKQNLISLIRQNYSKPQDQRKQQQILLNLKDTTINQLINVEKSKNMVLEERITNMLSIVFIIKKIQEFAKRKAILATLNHENPNKQENEKAVKANIFIKNLMGEIKEEGDVIKNFPCFLHFWKCLETLTISIEVLADNGIENKVQKIYFPKHPVFQYLAGQTRDNIMMKVERTTIRDKLISLLSFRQNIVQQIQLNYRLKYTPPFWFPSKSITSQLCKNTKKWATWISYFIIFLLLSYVIVEHDTKEQSSKFTYLNSQNQIMVRAVCLVQLILTICYLIIWKELRLPLAYHKHKKALQEQEQQPAPAEAQHQIPEQQKPQQQIVYPPIFDQEKPVQEDPNDKWSKAKFVKRKIIRYITIFERIKCRVLTKVTSILKIIKSKLSSALKIIVQLKPIIWGKTAFTFIYKICVLPLIVLFKYQESILSVVLFVSASILGNLYGVEWYTIHLFQLVSGFSQLTNIFKAIFRKLNQLLFLSFFCSIFIMVFNIISIGVYVPVIYEDDLPQQSCGSIIQCVLQLFTSGAIGDSMDTFDFGRFFFDTVYMVFMQMLFMNIIGSKMIDAFGQLKQEDTIRDEDKKGFCYICGKAKQDMEKQGETFQKHIDKHLAWNYIYYIYCLDTKPQTDYTGIQYTIKDKISTEDVTWFPSQSASEGPSIEDIMLEIQNKLNSNTQSFQKWYQQAQNNINQANKTIKTLYEQNNQLKMVSQ